MKQGFSACVGDCRVLEKAGSLCSKINQAPCSPYSKMSLPAWMVLVPVWRPRSLAASQGSGTFH